MFQPCTWYFIHTWNYKHFYGARYTMQTTRERVCVWVCGKKVQPCLRGRRSVRMIVDSLVLLHRRPVVRGGWCNQGIAVQSIAIHLVGHAQCACAICHVPLGSKFNVCTRGQIRVESLQRCMQSWSTCLWAAAELLTPSIGAGVVQ